MSVKRKDRALRLAAANVEVLGALLFEIDSKHLARVQDFGRWLKNIADNEWAGPPPDLLVEETELDRRMDELMRRLQNCSDDERESLCLEIDRLTGNERGMVN